MRLLLKSFGRELLKDALRTSWSTRETSITFDTFVPFCFFFFFFFLSVDM